ERNHEQEAKLFPETIRILGGFSRHDFFLAAWTSTLCGSRSSEKGNARIRSAFASRADDDSALARPGHSQPRKVAVRETEKRARARGHDRKWFLGAAPRSQRQQEYSFDGKIAGSQRPHGEFPPPHRKELCRAARAGVLRFRRLQVDRSRRFRSAVRRAARASRSRGQNHEGRRCRAT